jgi:hypothetical protein
MRGREDSDEGKMREIGPHCEGNGGAGIYIRERRRGWEGWLCLYVWGLRKF